MVLPGFGPIAAPGDRAVLSGPARFMHVDWNNGAVLHLSGSVAGRREPAGRVDGVERTIEFTIEHVVERQHVVALRWSVVANRD